MLDARLSNNVGALLLIERLVEQIPSSYADCERQRRCEDGYDGEHHVVLSPMNINANYIKVTESINSTRYEGFDQNYL